MLSEEEPEAEDKNPIELIYVLLDLKLGSGCEETLEFLKTIENSENEEIFKTQIIKNLIEYMWIRVKS